MLAIPRKKKIIRVIIVIAAFVDHALDNDENNTVQERVGRLIGRCDFLMDSWDENESNWTTAQNDLATLLDEIADAHAPEAMEEPTQQDYEGWERDLEDALGNL